MPDNQALWLETVPDGLRPFVQAAVADWNALADEANQWPDLGWDERDEVLRRIASAAG
jgi:hypothetical protein